MSNSYLQDICHGSAGRETFFINLSKLIEPKFIPTT